MNVLAQHTWLTLPLAIALSAGLGLLLCTLAPRFGWLDQPGTHKIHEQATPPVGGWAIFCALIIVITLTPTAPDFLSEPLVGPLLTGSVLLLVAGMIDDRLQLSPVVRFLLQAGVCFMILFWSGVRLDDFGRLFTGNVLHLGWLAVPITIFSAMGVINSFNLIDGMDGLSGTLFVVAAAPMAMFAAWAGHTMMVWFLLTAMASVFGFLLLNARFPWNSKAHMFLGNSGSMMLGLLLAWFFIRIGSGADRAFMPMTAVWLFAVPLLDTTTLMWRRWREGRSAFSADQNHLHHAFLRAGYSVGQAWSGITSLAVALAVFGIGFELSKLPEWLSFYCFMCVAFVYYFYLKHCWASQCFLGRHFIHHDFVIDDGYG